MEPTSVRMALEDSSWVEVIQEELQHFNRLGVWDLIDKSDRVKKPIPTKWVLKCKKDDRGVIFINKARLVVQGFLEQEGVYYTEDDSFDLIVFSVSDYGGCKINFKSTTAGCQFLGSWLVSKQCKK
ncbi:putative mitochondrial protein AtMg00820 [Bidens hawaiensis]|uniref:putative mitochondrial protein AtMg00820 n=1 Tax=Bidens hawaiensis TaxID=980011 RepID=UPI00404A5B8F